MSNQIRLAKSILESAGYTVSKRVNESEDHEGWEHWVMPKGYKGPTDPEMYYKLIDGEGLQATIYPPQTFGGDTYDDWSVQIVDIDGTHGRVDVIKEGFKSFEEAEAFVNDWIKENGYTDHYKSDIQESADLGSEDYILDTVDPAVSEAVKSITGDGFDDSSYDYKNGTLKGQGLIYIDKKKDTNKIHQRIEDAIKRSIESLGYENFRVYDKESEYNDPKSPFNSYRIWFRAHNSNDEDF